MKIENKKILFLCGAKKSYVRNAIVFKLLCKNNVVINISSDLPYYFVRIPIVLIRYIFARKKGVDCIYIGFLAQLLIPPVRLFTKKPIIADMFISVYDTLCLDRKRIKPDSLVGKFIFWIDKISCGIPLLIITDTKEHARYIIETFSVEEKKVHVVYLGAEKNIFFPRTVAKNKYKDKFLVFYYGAVNPLQGIEYILRAIKLLENNKEIFFIMVGPIEKQYKEFVRLMSKENVEFIPWIPYTELPDYIAQSDVCLGGHFGPTEKARRVIPGKAYQFAAMGKPIILGDNPANREIFTNNFDCVIIEMKNAQKLSDAIIYLKGNRALMEKIGDSARHTFLSISDNLDLEVL